eukprot:scaffold567_cov384-Prasinococcus_capsulatus_cf.AAC.19
MLHSVVGLLLLLVGVVVGVWMERWGLRRARAKKVVKRWGSRVQELLEEVDPEVVKEIWGAMPSPKHALAGATDARSEAWINELLERIWTSLSVAIGNSIKENLENVLNEDHIRPKFCKKIVFSCVNLGSEPIKVNSVKVHEARGDEVTLDLEVNWAASPVVILDLSLVGGLQVPVELNDFHFFGSLRLTLKPVVDEFPCFGAFSLTLLADPYVDFVLKVHWWEGYETDVMLVPGLEGWIRELIVTRVINHTWWISNDFRYIGQGIFPAIAVDTLMKARSAMRSGGGAGATLIPQLFQVGQGGCYAGFRFRLQR